MLFFYSGSCQTEIMFCVCEMAGGLFELCHKMIGGQVLYNLQLTSILLSIYLK